ncbi:CCA tRNA nucleotidyltransferase [Tissierella pigra]|uniref:CCA tRNA nucleotidyltransferase n=1 Tax=Tissierella pigra TaxID=2607614 RepID=A0A6N7XVI7_9FIRM|nr:CCA tRNA nucleotidyltransferase [Tissierella pigra]MBU5425789.1 CCA tRNA nucleotidyltransferase [Tissierella pigra]MSU01473.1 CCA tRNA nucleotidyltransferase [Tissierella pigra]
MEWNIPEYVDRIIDKLEANGYSGYIVGGSVRDILIGREPSDFDITTDALPDEIEEVFKEYKTLEVGKQFGTIVVVQEEGIVEVTTFRADGEYVDGRRPERVYFSKNIIDDLSRRDFTINSMAYNKKAGLIDYFQGKEDLKKRQIKTVGDPKERFSEDYLRIMRALRFASQLEFSIEESTFQACKLYSEYILNISIERIREEFFKILLCKTPSNGIRLMKDTGMLSIVLPEIMDTVRFNQHTPHHDKDVFEHILCVLDNTDPILELRLTALLHDIGKPHTLTIDENGIGHFYNHDKVGAKIAEKILKRLKASNELIETVSLLIYKHMTQHDNLGEKGLKRLLAIMGEERIFTLLELNKADRLCSNKDANIQDLIEREEKIKRIIENKEVYEKKQLTINGHDVIKLGYKEGKKIGEILNYLLEKVLENPELNDKEKLIEIIKEKFKASE